MHHLWADWAILAGRVCVFIDVCRPSFVEEQIHKLQKHLSVRAYTSVYYYPCMWLYTSRSFLNIELAPGMAWSPLLAEMLDFKKSKVQIKCLIIVWARQDTIISFNALTFTRFQVDTEAHEAIGTDSVHTIRQQHPLQLQWEPAHALKTDGPRDGILCVYKTNALTNIQCSGIYTTQVGLKSRPHSGMKPHTYREEL